MIPPLVMTVLPPTGEDIRSCCLLRRLDPAWFRLTPGLLSSFNSYVKRVQPPAG